MPDGVHIFHKLNENMCACNIRPYLLQLYRKMQKDNLFDEPVQEDEKVLNENTVDSTAQPPKKKGRKH